MRIIRTFKTLYRNKAYIYKASTSLRSFSVKTVHIRSFYEVILHIRSPTKLYKVIHIYQKPYKVIYPYIRRPMKLNLYTVCHNKTLSVENPYKRLYKVLGLRDH